MATNIATIAAFLRSGLPLTQVPATTSDELMTHTVLLYVMDIHVFQYMYVCMAGKWVFNDFLLEQDGRNRTGDTSL